MNANILSHQLEASTPKMVTPDEQVVLRQYHALTAAQQQLILRIMEQFLKGGVQ